MESPSIYRVNNPTYPPTDKRTKVLTSPYFMAVKDIAVAISISRDVYDDDDETLIARAIALTDLMIERVGEKL